MTTLSAIPMPTIDRVLPLQRSKPSALGSGFATPQRVELEPSAHVRIFMFTRAVVRCLGLGTDLQTKP